MKVSANERAAERVMDALMDGASTVGELASVLNMPITRVDSCVARLIATGLVGVVGHQKSMRGRTERIVDMVRTRKSAAA